MHSWSSHAYISHYRGNDLRSRVKYLKFAPDVASYVGSTLSSGTTRLFAIQTFGNSCSRMGMDWIFRMANSWARFGDVTINGCLMEPLVEHWRTCLRVKGSFSREILFRHHDRRSIRRKLHTNGNVSIRYVPLQRDVSAWEIARRYFDDAPQVLISPVKRKGQGIQWCFFYIFAFWARIPFR